MNRRHLITGLAGFLAAPALVRVASLDALPRGVALPAMCNHFDAATYAGSRAVLWNMTTGEWREITNWNGNRGIMSIQVGGLNPTHQYAMRFESSEAS